MKQMLVVILFSLILSACSPAPAPTVIPTSEPLPLPTETSVPLPTETPLPPTETPEPSPTPDPILFRDDFDGALDQWWIWTRENPQKWSLSNSPGNLEIGPEAGGVDDEAVKNLLLREAPSGNFQLETKMTFNPTGNFQFAGLIIFADPQNFVQFGKAYCDMGPCVGAGAYFDLTSNGSFSGTNFATELPKSDNLYLRLDKKADVFTAYYSIDGIEYKEIGSHTSSFQPVSVGLITGQTYGSLPKPAQYDYFIITALP